MGTQILDPQEPASPAAEADARSPVPGNGADAELRFRAQLLDAVGEAVIATDLDGRILFWNRSAEELYGWPAEEALGRSVLELTPSTSSREEAAAIMARLERGETWSGEFELRRRDGTSFPAHVTDTPIHDERGRLVGIVGVSHDLTERKTFEQQFRQAQRLETVGRLAGGVAHDFNNLLTVILGYCEILEQTIPADQPAGDAVAEVATAARRAATLTRQLLAFSRNQVLQPRDLDLGEVVSGLATMLRRLLGEEVELFVEIEPGLGRVRADRGQIEQVVMNLAVNARDAMPRGGRLTIGLRNEALAAGLDAEGDEIHAGAYVLLSAADTGTGMPPEVADHVFEPFFTTKEVGVGTGLGLSSVYGIVKQSGGCVRMRSEAGAGATFEVFLPRSDASRRNGPRP